MPMKLSGTVCLLSSLLLLGAVSDAGAVKVRNYFSPRNSERPVRAVTDFIILHTTEGSEAGSLRKLHENGEAHFLVTQSGGIYGLVHRNRVAYHAGVSMWNGRTNLDRRSIGIEVVGYHNGRLTALQYDALRGLLAELKKAFKIPEGRILTHSMVAYGEPNRWHRQAHRGRKRCGMVFANLSARKRLGINSWPSFDPDVRAKRLVNPDPYLSAMLYGSKVGTGVGKPPEGLVADPMIVSSTRSPWEIARDAYDQPSTRYRFPDGTEVAGNAVRDWKRIPSGTRVLLNVAPAAPQAAPVPPVPSPASQARAPVSPAVQPPPEPVAPAPPPAAAVAEPTAETTAETTAVSVVEQRIAAQSDATKPTTLYLFADGRVLSGVQITAEVLERLPAGTQTLTGYVLSGSIMPNRSAFDLCGVKWNLPTTVYRLPDGTIRSGDVIKAGAIPRGTLVFTRLDGP